MKSTVCIFSLLIAIFFFSPTHVWAQKKMLTPVDLPVKIAIADFTRIRNDYKAYHAYKDSLFKAIMVQRTAFETARQQLDKESKEQLKKDSTSGGKQKGLILNNTTAKQNELANNYSTQLRQRRQKGQAAINDYEKKINDAVQLVMAQGLYTQLKTPKNSSGIKGTDITDLVLRKLNK